MNTDPLPDTPSDGEPQPSLWDELGIPEPRRRRAGQGARRKMSPKGWRRFDGRAMLGEALLGQEKHQEAETRLLAGYEGLSKFAEQNPRADPSLLRVAAQRLIELYDAWGKKEAADSWRKRLGALVDGTPKAEP